MKKMILVLVMFTTQFCLANDASVNDQVKSAIQLIIQGGRVWSCQGTDYNYNGFISSVEDFMHTEPVSDIQDYVIEIDKVNNLVNATRVLTGGLYDLKFTAQFQLNQEQTDIVQITTKSFRPISKKTINLGTILNPEFVVEDTYKITGMDICRPK